MQLIQVYYKSYKIPHKNPNAPESGAVVTPPSSIVPVPNGKPIPILISKPSMSRVFCHSGSQLGALVHQEDQDVSFGISSYNQQVIQEARLTSQQKDPPCLAMAAVCIGF